VTKLLDLLKGEVDAAEQARVTKRVSQVAFREGKPREACTSERLGHSLRVIAEGRLGTATATGPLDAELAATVARAALMSAAAGEVALYDFPAAAEYADPELYDPHTAGLVLADLVALGRATVEELSVLAPDFELSLDVALIIKEESLTNSRGIAAEQRSTLVGVGMHLSRASADDLVNLYAEASAREPRAAFAQARAALLRRLEWSRHEARVGSGRLPVLLLPDAAAVLFVPLEEGLDGLDAALGTSPLGGRVGQAIFDRRLSLIDDGTLVGGALSSRFDGEGVPRRRTPLVRLGELRSYYHDLHSAARLGVRSTGNGLRADVGLPARGPGNWVVEAPATAFDRLLRDVGRGLLVGDLLGMGQANTRDGAFSSPVGLGFLVDGGEVVGRVSDLSIAGNAYEVLRSGFVAAGDDAAWTEALGFPLHVPTLATDGLSVVAKA